MYTLLRNLCPGLLPFTKTKQRVTKVTVAITLSISSILGDAEDARQWYRKETEGTRQAVIR
jgi:hypothetical protein